MPAVSHRLKLVFFPIPKNACSSIKALIYRADTGRDFGDDVHTKETSVHAIYPSVQTGEWWAPYYEHYDTFLVLRDPLDRFISAFKNRILAHGDVLIENRRRAPDGKEDPLAPYPEVNEFIEAMDVYMKYSVEVFHHFCPQAEFVRKVIPKTSRIFQMSDLSLVAELVSIKAGIRLDMPWLQTTGRERHVGKISDRNLLRLKRFYAEDYELMRTYTKEKSFHVSEG